MPSESNSDATLETCLFKQCEEGRTGTVSIATNNNKSCQIVITNGEIIAVTLARLKGYDAINELLKVGFKRASFNQDLQLPFKEDARIDSSHKLLIKLGYDSFNVKPKESENNENSSKPDEKNPSTQRMYRGQIIKD